MKLAQWRDREGWTQQRLADELGCTVSAIWRYEQGLRDPDASVKERIFAITSGAVEPNDFYDVPRWRRMLSSVVAALAGKAA